MTDGTEEILFDRIGDWGVVTLNRPRALNALTLDMVRRLRAQLVAWEAENAVRAVLVKGAGGRAFCAGADIRRVSDAAKSGSGDAVQFFTEEYRVNAAIHRFAKPYVALVNGITMGGGVGLSVHGDFRVAGDRTVIAMPETGIGLFPDVGGGHFMPRMHDGLGLYYALTGARAGPADAMAAGFATHYAPDDRHEALEAALLGTSLGGHAHADIEAILDDVAGDPGHAEINDLRGALAPIFDGHDSLEALIAHLQKVDQEFARDLVAVLARMSPTSLKLTFEQMRRGRTLDFDDVMRMELRMVLRVMEGHDFHEGVRAVILDKDNAPVWVPARLEDVTDAAIAAHFEPLGEKELPLP